MNKSNIFDFSLELNNKETPIYQQIVGKILNLIDSGILKSGEPIPSSRELSRTLNVSRKTILTAMDILVFSGYLTNKERVGLFVTENHPLKKKVETPKVSSDIMTIDDGFPDTKLLPYLEFSRSYRQAFNRAAKWQQLGYFDPRGYEPFRGKLVSMLCHERGLNIDLPELCITRGSQMALYLSAHALFSPGDTIILERPCYHRAYEVFESAGLNVVQVDVDENGVNVDEIEKLLFENHSIKALYLTPRYQYPTTVTLSQSRREKLAELIKRYCLTLIEDDFGSMFNYSSNTHLLPFSHMLDKHNFVYIGTFSKIFAPAIRTGYVVSCKENIDKMANLRTLIDIQGDKISERAMFELIENGEVHRHLKRVIRTYHEKLDFIARLITEKLSDKVLFAKPKGGLSVWVEVKKYIPAKELEEKILHRNISIPVFELSGNRVGFRIGFASMSEENISFLINILNRIL